MRALVYRVALFRGARLLRIASAAVLVALASSCTLVGQETPEQAQRNQYFLSNRAGAP
jgi:hypothetical protein